MGELHGHMRKLQSQVAQIAQQAGWNPGPPPPGPQQPSGPDGTGPPSHAEDGPEDGPDPAAVGINGPLKVIQFFHN